jgi:hypothetical protein
MLVKRKVLCERNPYGKNVLKPPNYTLNILALRAFFLVTASKDSKI